MPDDRPQRAENRESPPLNECQADPGFLIDPPRRVAGRPSQFPLVQFGLDRGTISRDKKAGTIHSARNSDRPSSAITLFGLSGRRQRGLDLSANEARALRERRPSCPRKRCPIDRRGVKALGLSPRSSPADEMPGSFAKYTIPGDMRPFRNTPRGHTRDQRINDEAGVGRETALSAETGLLPVVAGSTSGLSISGKGTCRLLPGSGRNSGLQNRPDIKCRPSDRNKSARPIS